MRKIQSFLSIGFLAMATPLFAGVEMDLVTKDAEGAVTESVKLYAQSGKIRMEDIGDTSGKEMSMIFVGQEFIVVDHTEQSYIVMDEEMVAALGAKVNDAMAQIQAQLADMPEEQRAQIEQMLAGQMAGMMNESEQAPAARVEQIGVGTWQSAECTQYAVFEDFDKTQEICAAPLGDIEGADEVMLAFKNMAKFVNTISESMPGALGANMAQNPMGLIDQIDGFPVRTIDYLDGSLMSVTTLESVQDMSLDPGLFAIPEGYTQVDPFAGQKPQ